ncbi:hypothetical protein BT63DRAFT_442595 [Microthyrium microscopicum]|uniref:BTB domain-containing protein n=1 Tax=Microthyrium microscopicum TaxID=703497 RepID=A0A6A6U225_9PEZI|nr:hypothetical protein BT63DRAFT_442595 [Microthyrium microscopicum]
MSTDKITLEVGDQTFTTTKDILIHGIYGGSDYFRSMFDLESRMAEQSSTTITTEATQKDTTPHYYYDFDPPAFAHILSYLRTGVMPLLWTREDGFDGITYAKIEALADYLQVERLKSWIEKGLYKSVVHQKARMTLRKFPVHPAYMSDRDSEIKFDVKGETVLDWELLKSADLQNGRVFELSRTTIINRRSLFPDT